MQVDAAHNFLFAPEALEAAITEKTKAVVINSPANPTGGIAGREALERLAGIIMRHDLWVISDEVYRELVYDGNEAFSMAMLPGMRERTVVVNSFSKTYAMTGWRVGYALGPACIIGNMVKLQENVAACVNSAAQYGALAALEGPREPVDRMVRAYGRRRQMILDGFASIPGLACYTPQGAFYAFVDISATGMKAGAFAMDLLEKARVIVVPGHAFGDASEECEVSGAQAMMELGAVDDVDAVIGAHCDNTLETGLIGVRAGDYMAACDPFTVTFLGKTAHATQPEQGVDAIAMAWEAYGQLKELARSEAGDDTVYIFSIGCFQGGTAHNVIADQCLLKISFRYYDMEFAKRVQEKTMALCRQLAERYGGSVEFDWPTSTLAVYNDPALAAQFVQSTGRILPGRVVEIPLRKSSEDFSWFMTRKPGLLFRFGTRNETLGCTTMAHCNDFLLDEAGMRSAIDAFVQFVLDW